MKLPAVLKRDTAGALEKVQQAIAAGEARLVELGKQHEAALESDDSIEQARALARQMEEERGNLAELNARREKLEVRLACAREEEDKKAYEAAVARLEQPLARRCDAAVEVKRAMSALAEAVRKFAACDAAVIKAWHGAPWPANVSHFAIGTTRLAGRLHDELAPDYINRLTRRPVSPGETLDRVLRADLSGFPAAEAEHGRALLQDLRHAHDPIPVEEDSESENPDEEEAAA